MHSLQTQLQLGKCRKYNPYRDVEVFPYITWQIKSPIKVNNAEVIAFVWTGYLARRLKYLNHKEKCQDHINVETRLMTR